jgi:hypothetical protein
MCPEYGVTYLSGRTMWSKRLGISPGRSLVQPVCNGGGNVRPKVFVSSTFYDLRQVRDDLRSFIDRLGYEPLLSEHHSFPVDPSVDTIENCRRRVDRDADILILIIGARYGSLVPDNSRSVTNTEYLAARAKRIPIYVFMERKLDTLLAVWKDNPGVDLTGQIDSPKLLEFVARIRNEDRVWASPFDRASEIEDALRARFAQWTRGGDQPESSFRNARSLMAGGWAFVKLSDEAPLRAIAEARPFPAAAETLPPASVAADHITTKRK